MDQKIQDLIDVAVENEDQTDVSSGNFAYELPPEGKTMARLVEYIELGKKPQRAFKGKDKPDCEEVRITFELLSKKHIKEVDIDGKTVEITNKFSITLPKKLNKKAKFFKLFNKLTYGRDITHIAQMLGEAFIITIYHNTVGEGDDKRTYVNLNPDGGDYGVESPFHEDPVTGDVTELPVPPAKSDLRIFLWENPTVETWASLYIDGTRTKTVDGKEMEVSKNWLQDSILSATDFEGSALEGMLSGADELPDITQEDEAEEVQEETPKKKTTRKKSVKTAAKPSGEKKTAEVDSAKDVETDEEDPLIALGLA